MWMRLKTASFTISVVCVVSAVNFIANRYFVTHSFCTLTEGLLIAAVGFLIVGTIAAVCLADWIVRLFQQVETQKNLLLELQDTVLLQTLQIQSEHMRIKIMLDATPLSCCLWNKDFQVFECNDAAITCFNLTSKQEYFDRVFELSPEYQPNGTHSREQTIALLKRAFEGVRCTFEWMHQTLNGTPIPAETVFVRVNYADSYAVAAYTRDLREHKQMMAAIERRDALLDTMNQVAAVLLQSDVTSFRIDLHRCMEMMVKAIGVNCAHLWKNHIVDDDLCCTELYGWSDSTPMQLADEELSNVSYQHKLSGWLEILERGECVCGSIRDMSPIVQARLLSRKIVSIFVVPIFFQDQFWGFMSYDDCHSEREFSENERSILRSGGMLIANAVLRNDITLRLRSSAIQLESALGDAHAANRAKSIFLAHMSHEMRTPLNAVIGLCSLTLENCELDESVIVNLEKIYNAAEILLNTVNDVLDISKIEAGKLELQPGEYELASLINDTVTQNILRIDKKPIEFVLDIDVSLPAYLYGDELRVRQIFNNLLSNAFKYTIVGTVTMSILCEREGDSVWLTGAVQDTGIGIFPEDMSLLFSDYSQIDKKVNRYTEGTGLGLAITKKMVEMMDGTISVESEHGKGSTFTVKLRQGYVADAVMGHEIVKNLKNYRDSIGSRYNRHSEVVCAKLPYAHVLVVDDNLTNLDVTQGIMKPYGMKIDCMTSGQQAIDIIRAGKVKYNAIFMDHTMPGIDGIQATKIIRNMDTEYAKTVPIIALTANAVIGSEEMFLSNGFQAFLSKPIEISHLDEILERWVRNEEQEKLLLERSPEQGLPEESDGQRRRKGGANGTGVNRRSGVDRQLVGGGIIGVDIRKGIRRFGDWDSYIEVLRSFVLHTRPLLEKMRYIDRDHLADYAIIIHGIKGAIRGICAERLAVQASLLEDAARADNFDLVSHRTPDFMEVLVKLLSDIDNLVAKMDKAKGKPQKDKPDVTLLSELLTACENYDMDNADAALEKITAYEYVSDDGLVTWLRENVEQMNFVEIKERLSTLIESKGA